MLADLRIQDFAIVEDLQIHLAPGLNVLTGETGAGKSIVVDAIGFVLGSRASGTLVRNGARLARVEAGFGLPAGADVRQALLERLEACGVAAEEETVVLARELSASGRNAYRINGSMVTQAVLREVGDLLVEIHGQNEHFGLLSAARHLDFLDRLGGAAVEAWRVPLRASWERWRQLRAERDGLLTQQRERERRREWLAFEVEEIEGAALVAEPDEIEALTAERGVLANADKIRVRVEEALALLEDGAGEGGARSLLGRVARLLGQVAGVDAAAQSSATAAEAAMVAVDELTRDLGSYAENVEANPLRLEQIQERLEQIHRLQKKYGTTIAEIVAYAARARHDLTELEGSETRIAELEADIAMVGRELAAQAASLSQARREVAASLEARVSTELAELEMKGTRFSVRFWADRAEDGLAVAGLGEAAATWQVGASGADRVEFLISPNPGQPLLPLNQIASGGEMSRIMLAIQSVLAEVDPVPTLIFDEVDAGLGGVAAEAVAVRLRKIAGSRQVVCITHLPLVAAAAGTHWTVVKEVIEGQTRTHARPLGERDRATEIARMLAGKQASQTTVRQAEELLGQRRRGKAGVN